MEKNNTTMSGSMPGPDFLTAAGGPVAIRLTNDYLFRALLQRSNKALKGLTNWETPPMRRPSSWMSRSS